MDSIIVYSAKYLLFLSLVVAGIAFLYTDRTTKIKTIWLGLIASPIALIITEIFGRLVYDPRPFVVDNIQPLFEHAADNGFPSDHALAAALVAFVVFSFNKKVGFVLIVFTILIGVARILARVHHLLDIVGGISIALVSVVSAYYILKAYYPARRSS